VHVRAAAFWVRFLHPDVGPTLLTAPPIENVREAIFVPPPDVFDRLPRRNLVWESERKKVSFGQFPAVQ
jgi:hypothetical protein